MKRLLFAMFLAVTFGACMPLTLSTRVKKLEIGMSKAEATAVMGNYYDVEFASSTPEGAAEVLRYNSHALDTYLLKFVNGELVEFHKYVPLVVPGDRVDKEGHQVPGTGN